MVKRLKCKIRSKYATDKVYASKVRAEVKTLCEELDSYAGVERMRAGFMGVH